MTLPKKGKDPVSFEKAMERLELIVSEMDDGALPLDQLIERFEEGQGLISFCTGKLNEVDKKIETLTRKGDHLEKSPFEESSLEPEA